ncbi:MAG: RNA polymerase sigma factor [Sphingorhabdus sp.]
MTSNSLTLTFPQAGESDTPVNELRGIESLQVEQLYLTHSAELEKFLLARTRSKDITEVIMQDIYLKLMAIPDLGIIKHPNAYLIRLANNLLIDHIRHQNRQRQHFEQRPVEEMDYTSPEPCLAEQAHYAQLLAQYQQALGELPSETQEIVRLHHVEGLSQPVIAQKLGKSLSWIEKSIAKALIHCHNRIGDINY